MKKIKHYKVPNYIKIMWLTLLIAIVFALLAKDWSTVFISLSVLGVSLYAIKLSQQIEFKIPHSLLTASITFIYATLFLGEVQDFYEKFWWWDIVIHTGSAIGFGLIGAIILVLIYKRGKVTASPLLICIFIFSFAVAIGAVWEIFEYTVDSFFGTSMQKSGLDDTMSDLIVDSIGALLSAAASYRYFVTKKADVLSAVIDEAVKDN